MADPQVLKRGGEGVQIKVRIDPWLLKNGGGEGGFSYIWAVILIFSIKGGGGGVLTHPQDLSLHSNSVVSYLPHDCCRRWELIL